MWNLLVGMSWIVAFMLLVLCGTFVVAFATNFWRIIRQGPVHIKWSVSCIRLKQP